MYEYNHGYEEDKKMERIGLIFVIVTIVLIIVAAQFGKAAQFVGLLLGVPMALALFYGIGSLVVHYMLKKEESIFREIVSVLLGGVISITLLIILMSVSDYNEEKSIQKKIELLYTELEEYESNWGENRDIGYERADENWIDSKDDCPLTEGFDFEAGCKAYIVKDEIYKLRLLQSKLNK